VNLYVFKIQIVFIWGYKKLLFGFLFSNTKIFVILPEECYQAGRPDGIIIKTGGNHQ